MAASSRRIRTFGPTVALALALLPTLAGCGAGASGSSGAQVPARSAVEGLAGRQCRYVADHDATPTLAEITRVGTLGNIDLWGREMGPADTVELSIRYAEDGRLEWVQAIRATADTQRVAGLQALVLEALDERGTPDWGVRALLVGGDLVRTAPSVICRPERVAGSGVWSAAPSTRDALGEFFRVRGRRYPVRVALDEEGRVMDVDLLRSTYSRWVDQYIIDYVRNSTFEPKLHDGIGVASILEVELRLPRR